MTLKIETQKDEQQQLAVTIEVDNKRIVKAMQKSARVYSRDLNIPGFRRGKAPYGIIKGYVGEEALRQEALNDILPAIFQETLEQIEVEPFAQPTLDDVDFDPLVLKMTVPLDPIVTLGDYRAERKEIEAVEISDEAVTEALVALQEQAATNDPVERPSQEGDEVVLEGKAYVGDDEEDVVFNETHFHVTLNADDNPYPDTEFVNKLMGLSAESEKSFAISFPEDYSDDDTLAGKTANFTVTVSEVLERKVPELNDEFAAEQPGEHETLEALRAATADRLQTQAEEQQKNDLLDEAVGSMLENVEAMTYPPGAVEAEIDGMIQGMKNQIQQMGWNWDAYVQSRQLSEEEIREEYEDEAVTRLERSLILRAFVDAEKLSVSDEQVEAAIEDRMKGYDEEMAGYMRPFFEQDNGMMLRNELMMTNIHERLIAIYSGEAPDLDAVEEAVAEASDEVVEEAAAVEAEAVAEDVADDEAVSSEEAPSDE